MHPILKQIKQKPSNEQQNQTLDHKTQKTPFTELINEYADGHELLSAAVSDTFPCGSSKELMGTATALKSMRETWMLFYDRSWAEELH